MAGSTVIIGASVAGVRTAQALRSLGYRDAITLVDQDLHAPYDRPPLSKQFLAGSWDAERISLLPADRAGELGVELLRGQRASRLDTGRAVVELSGGTEIGYDTLVVATGARPRPSPWTVPGRVFVLRTLAHAQALRSALVPGRRLAVIGGGFIGAEVATTAYNLGLTVTVIDPLRAPMARVVGDEVGRFLARLPHRYGVATRLGVAADLIAPDGDGVLVRLGDGEVIHCDLAVVGIGAVPNDDWLTSSGLTVEDGVWCDEAGRAEGVCGVYAVGDVARWFSPGFDRHRRVEHWTSAVEQATCVGHRIARPAVAAPRPGPDYVWSDQYGVTVQVAGVTGDALDRHWLGDLDRQGRVAILYGEHGRLRGAVTVGWPSAMLACRRGLARGALVEEAIRTLTGSAGTPQRPAACQT